MKSHIIFPYNKARCPQLGLNSNVQISLRKIKDNDQVLLRAARFYTQNQLQETLCTLSPHYQRPRSPEVKGSPNSGIASDDRASVGPARLFDFIRTTRDGSDFQNSISVTVPKDFNELHLWQIEDLYWQPEICLQAEERAPSLRKLLPTL